MYEISKLKELLSESLINDLYSKREDRICERTSNEKEEIKELLEKEKKDMKIF